MIHIKCKLFDCIISHATGLTSLTFTTMDRSLVNRGELYKRPTQVAIASDLLLEMRKCITYFPGTQDYNSLPKTVTIMEEYEVFRDRLEDIQTYAKLLGSLNKKKSPLPKWW